MTLVNLGPCRPPPAAEYIFTLVVLKTAHVSAVLALAASAAAPAPEGQLEQRAVLVRPKPWCGPKRRLEHKELTQDSFTHNSLHLFQKVPAPVKEKAMSCSVSALFSFQRKTFEHLFVMDPEVAIKCDLIYVLCHTEG